jgi:ABC-2 type transport system ATP-binding protein
VEGATFYPFLTGRRNLEVLARTSDCYDSGRISLLLNQLGMADRADRRVNGYSTGMKQRLGVAGALLTDPELVILDEPTNGLDPAGIQEMRVFIRDLVNNHGKTVFLSSHLLSEVEQVCDRVAIISEGQLVREGSVVDLLAGTCQLRIEVAPLAQVSQVLSERWQVNANGTSVTINAARPEIPYIVRQLVEHGLDIYQVTEERQRLEAYFLSVTQTEVEHGESVSR